MFPCSKPNSHIFATGLQQNLLQPLLDLIGRKILPWLPCHVADVDTFITKHQTPGVQHQAPTGCKALVACYPGLQHQVDHPSSPTGSCPVDHHLSLITGDLGGKALVAGLPGVQHQDDQPSSPTSSCPVAHHISLIKHSIPGRPPDEAHRHVNTWFLPKQIHATTSH